MAIFPNLILGVFIALSGQFSFAEFDPSLPFITKTKFEALKGTSSGTWARDGEEMEMTYKFTCNDSNVDNLALDKNIYKALTANNFEKFRKMVKCKECTAVSQGIDSPEMMAWDKVSHAVRLNLGYMPITIEVERLTPQESPSTLKLSYGTDLMDDVYFDTDEFTAITNYYALRARKRWDSASITAKPEMRRILVGLKNTPPIDPKGLKTAMKIDDRFDTPGMEQILSFVSEVPTGLRNLFGTQYPIPSVVRLYEGLSNKGVLVDQGNEIAVLQLKPKTFLRSLRLRFHYGSLAEKNSINLLNYSKKIVAEVLMASKELDITSLSESDKQSVAKMISLAEVILEPSAYLQDKGLLKADLPTENNDIFKDGYVNTSGILNMPFADLQKSIQTAETMASLYKDLGYAIEHSASLFAKEPAKNKEAAGLKKALFLVANGQSKFPYGMPEVASFYFAALNDLIQNNGGINKATEILNAKISLQKQVNNSAFADVEALSEKQVQNALDIFNFKKYEEAGRQVEAGSAAYKQMIYMMLNVAILGTYSATFNMFIDTVDLVGMFKAGPLEVDEYSSTDPKAAPVRKQLDFNNLTNNHVITANAIENNLIGAYLSNDVQLELGLEQPILQALKKWDSDPMKKANAEWILNQIEKFQKTMAKLKIISINNFIDKKDPSKAGCSKFSWKPTDMPKGESSLRKLMEMEKANNGTH